MSAQSDIRSFAEADQYEAIPPAEEIETVSGVRDLRAALEWYRNAHGRTDDGLHTPVSGVWNLICGKPAKGITGSNDKTPGIGEMESNLVDNREKFVRKDNNRFTPGEIDRVIGLLRGLQEVDTEYRVYGDNREATSAFDVVTKCYVGLYHVTDRTTIMTYLHITPGMGPMACSGRGIEAPRMDVEEKLRDEVFTNKYNYQRLDESSGDKNAEQGNPDSESGDNREES
jgi:hypothetical protein